MTKNFVASINTIITNNGGTIRVTAAQKELGEHGTVGQFIDKLREQGFKVEKNNADHHAFTIFGTVAEIEAEVKPEVKADAKVEVEPEDADRRIIKWDGDKRKIITSMNAVILGLIPELTPYEISEAMGVKLDKKLRKAIRELADAGEIIKVDSDIERYKFSDSRRRALRLEILKGLPPQVKMTSDNPYDLMTIIKMLGTDHLTCDMEVHSDVEFATSKGKGITRDEIIKDNAYEGSAFTVQDVDDTIARLLKVGMIFELDGMFYSSWTYLEDPDPESAAIELEPEIEGDLPAVILRIVEAYPHVDFDKLLRETRRSCKNYVWRQEFCEALDMLEHEGKLVCEHVDNEGDFYDVATKSPEPDPDNLGPGDAVDPEAVAAAIERATEDARSERLFEMLQEGSVDLIDFEHCEYTTLEHSVDVASIDFGARRVMYDLECSGLATSLIYPEVKILDSYGHPRAERDVRVWTLEPKFQGLTWEEARRELQI